MAREIRITSSSSLLHEGSELHQPRADGRQRMLALFRSAAIGVEEYPGAARLLHGLAIPVAVGRVCQRREAVQGVGEVPSAGARRRTVEIDDSHRLAGSEHAVVR